MFSRLGREQLNDAMTVAAGGMAWFMWAAVLPSMPLALRFVITFSLFVLGPGAAVIAVLARDVVDPLERWVLALAAGLPLTFAIAQLFGQIGIITAYPATACALGGFAIGRGFLRRPSAARSLTRYDVAACAVVVGLALGVGLISYAHRTARTPVGVTFFGDFDTFDSTYYAAVSAELANEIPPQAPFRAGHRLGYSYHAQLIPAMIHRFGDVPLVDLYFRYVWPAYLLVASLTIFVTVRRIASPERSRGTSSSVALLATCLVLLGSDFSYIAAYLRPAWADWDRIMWPNNWMTPSAEQLSFNTWTPTLAVVCLGLWMLDRHEADSRSRWLVAAAACFGSLLPLKPFAFAALIGGLSGSAAFCWADYTLRRRFLLVLGGSLLFAVPYAYGIVTVYDESQAVLRLGSGYGTVITNRVLHHVGLGRVLDRMMDPFGETATTIVSMLVANFVFIVGGLGARLLALPALWRIVKGQDGGSAWRLIGWTILAGAAFPLVVVTEPDNQSFNTYHASLYLLWIVLAREVLRWTRSRAAQLLIAAAVIAIAMPSTVHYLRVKWHDVPFAVVHQDTYTIADRLRQESHDRTVFLQRYPQGPSYLVVFSGRRTVLAWSGYRRNSAALAAEIDRFFRSADAADDAADAALSLLMQHHVTHVVETKGVDRIHPRVIACLNLLLETETLKLHAVRSDDERCATDRVLTSSMTTSSAPDRVRDGA
jgi:hypothetical protein